MTAARWASVAALVLVGCGPGDDTGDIAAATCEEVECPGGVRVEWGDGADLAVTCSWDCIEMDGGAYRVERTWWRHDGECFVLEAESREVVGWECE